MSGPPRRPAGGTRMAVGLGALVGGLFLLPGFLVMNGFNVAGEHQTESSKDLLAISAADFHERAAQARRQSERR